MKSAAQGKCYYDKRVKPQELSPCNEVLVYCSKSPKNCYSKWQRLYTEEAKILSKVNYIIYVIKPAKSLGTKVIHGDKLKLLEKAADEQALQQEPAASRGM
jgi:hypothetical protein